MGMRVRSRSRGSFGSSRADRRRVWPFRESGFGCSRVEVLMRQFFLCVAILCGAFVVAWVFGWGHVGDIHQQDYGLAIDRGEEIIPPIPSPLRPLYERVPGRYAGLAAAVSLVALIMAQAVGLRPELFAGVTDPLLESLGLRPRPMAIRGRNGLQARVRRWMRTHRRATYRGETRYSIAKSYREEKHERLLGQPTSSSSQSF